MSRLVESICQSIGPLSAHVIHSSESRFARPALAAGAAWASVAASPPPAPRLADAALSIIEPHSFLQFRD
ncbi:hypothetical protein EVAR_18962_1 [Eumeta japonica]|uniref:Uncharacterized protein n=1 Tax=Eumeta variegata TaxID=151549 RepID=A0A4C1WWE9_EUMVA|nr:hypothetical protein EVAR_18962_1 [Eumeta japonica]